MPVLVNHVVTVELLGPDGDSVISTEDVEIEAPTPEQAVRLARVEFEQHGRACRPTGVTSTREIHENPCGRCQGPIFVGAEGRTRNGVPRCGHC